MQCKTYDRGLNGCICAFQIVNNLLKRLGGPNFRKNVALSVLAVYSNTIVGKLGLSLAQRLSLKSAAKFPILIGSAPWQLDLPLA